MSEQPGRPGAEAVRPIAYLYHDATSAETANPLIHSTLVVMAADRKPTLRNETPLVTFAKAQAMVAAETQRCAQYCHDQRMALRAVLTDEDNGTWHDGVADGWGLAAVALRKGPNAKAQAAP